MNKIIHRLSQKFTSGLITGAGVVCGLLLFGGITYAAVTITTNTVTSGTPLTSTIWNSMKTDLDNLAAAFADIASFDNVNISGAQNGDVLSFDGSNWVNSAAAASGGGSVTYAGTTSTTTNGNVSGSGAGFTELDDYCEDAFSGSRAVRSSEILQIRTSLDASNYGWVHCDEASCSGYLPTDGGSTDRLNCGGNGSNNVNIAWDSNSSSQYGLIARSGSISRGGCNSSYRAICVTD